MRNVPFLMALCLSMLISTPSLASAAGPLEEIVACLEQQTVCVTAGAEGTTEDTARELTSHLAADDRIVIVMLPASNRASINNSLSAFARHLDEATQQQFIISLSAGGEITGYSSVLPPGVAEDLMERAASVSTNIPETHGTFVRNVHNWQKAHPDAVPPLPTPSDGDEFPFGIVSVGTLILVGGLGFIIARRIQRPERRERTPRFTAPHAVKELLEAIIALRHQINDASLRSQIVQACRDTDAYFDRNKQSIYIKSDIDVFTGHLQRVCDVLSEYIYIQNHPRYCKSPEMRLIQGRDAIDGYAVFVLSYIQRGVDLRLVDFEVNTDILSAQREV